MDCALGVASKLGRARAVLARVGDTGSAHPATKREAARKATMCLMRQLRGGRWRASFPPQRRSAGALSRRRHANVSRGATPRKDSAIPAERSYHVDLGMAELYT